MKKKILVEIEHPDCDTLNIAQADLMTIQNEVLNQLCIVEEVAEGRFEIDAKVIEPIDEDKLDELVHQYIDQWDDTLPKTIMAWVDGFKVGYRKAIEE